MTTDYDAETAGARIVEALDELHRVGLWVEDWLAAHDTLGERLEMYGLIEDAIAELRVVADLVGQSCIPLRTTFEPVPVPGGGLFKVSGGRERKRYDNERLISALAERIQAVMGLTGIITSNGEHGDATPVVDAIVKKVAAATGAGAPSFDGWRSGVIKELRLKLNDYAEVETTPLKPRIEGRRRR